MCQLLCKNLINFALARSPKPLPPRPRHLHRHFHSHILIVVSRPQQRLKLNGIGLVILLEVCPEELQPVSMLRSHRAEEVALEELDEVLKRSFIEGRLSASSDEVPIPKNKSI